MPHVAHHHTLLIWSLRLWETSQSLSEASLTLTLAWAFYGSPQQLMTPPDRLWSPGMRWLQGFHFLKSVLQDADLQTWLMCSNMKCFFRRAVHVAESTNDKHLPYPSFSDNLLHHTANKGVNRVFGLGFNFICYSSNLWKWCFMF